MTRTMLTDYLNRYGMLVFVIAALIATVLFVASLAVLYVDAEYANPAWNERSVPPPKPY